MSDMMQDMMMVYRREEMPRAEEQWEPIGECIYCRSPIFKMDDRMKFTGPPGCNCKLVIENITEKWKRIRERKNETWNDLLA